LGFSLCVKSSIKRPGDGSSYSISKCALNHFLVRLADEFKATGGLDVSIYSPGIVDTAQTHMEDFPYEGIKMTPAKAADLWCVPLPFPLTSLVYRLSLRIDLSVFRTLFSGR
jgi:NAD(P)-dependent dehydrogenase (short-subunit alcohol dehydrogenase family)